MKASHRLLLAIVFAASISTAACASDYAGNSTQDAGEFTPSDSGSPAAASPASPPQATTADGLKVIQTSKLEISIANVLGAYDRIVESARTAGGYVSRADIRQQDGNPSASIQVRVPASRHEELLTTIRALPGARIDNESITSKEISGEYTDLEARIRNLERTEAQYQQFLTQAKTIDEVLNVSGRLQSTRDEIERTRGRLNLYDNQVEYASLDLQIATLVAPTANTPMTPARVLANGWEASVYLVRLSLTTLTASLFVVAWLLPLGAATLASVRIYRRVAPVVSRLFQ